MNIAERPQSLITMRDLDRLGIEPRSMRRALEKGSVVRVKRGAYCDRVIWNQLDDRARHLHRVYAVVESHPGSVFSHQSAAALLGLPILDSWPDDVHVTTTLASGGRSEAGVRRHCTGVPTDEVVETAQFGFTAPLRTLADLARSTTFGSAVTTADAALRTRLILLDDLPGYIDSIKGLRGTNKVKRAFEFSSPLAANPGESLSRVLIHELGFPSPMLQVRHPRSFGSADYTDFEWVELKKIGEFDGKGKYLKEEYLKGLTPGEAVYREKRREDRLRAEGNDVARWGWPELMTPSLLRRILLAAGLPIIR